MVGRTFEINDYGICFLEDILAEVPENTVIVDGAGHDMVISLPRRGTAAMLTFVCFTFRTCTHTYEYTVSKLQWK